MQDATAYIKDAKAGYIAEDFLSEQLKDLRRLVKNMRGENRLVLLDIITQIEEEVLEEARNGDYGAECLKKIEDVMWS